jgi:hypothetical protein
MHSMSKRYVVTLTEGERAALRQQLAAGRGPARHLTRARILLKADEGRMAPAGRTPPSRRPST